MSEELVCGICNKNDEEIKIYGKWLMGTSFPICFRCFSLWYDGITDTDIIREQSLKNNYCYKSEDDRGKTK
jgi:hypothetical protein